MSSSWPRHSATLVAGWQPVNETNYYSRAAYGGRGWPPGHHDRAEVAMVEESIQLAAAEAAVRLRQTGRPVSSIFGSVRPSSPRTTTRRRRYFAQRLFDTYWAPGLGLFRDGVLDVRGRDVVERPDLAGAFDMIGFSYYAAMGVSAGQLNIHPPDAPVSPLGYGIWADGVGVVLDRLHELLPDTPLLVAEYGIGTDDDAVRSAYLERGLEVVHDAISRGIDVRGLFHWTAVDNYEWLHGFDVAFGIIDRDRNVRNSATHPGPRGDRPSRSILSESVAGPPVAAQPPGGRDERPRGAVRRHIAVRSMVDR